MGLFENNSVNHRKMTEKGKKKRRITGNVVKKK
jgi:hypothetical protein